MYVCDVERDKLHMWTDSLTRGNKAFFKKRRFALKYKYVFASTRDKIEKYLRKHPDTKELTVLIMCTGLPRYKAVASKNTEFVIDLQNSNDDDIEKSFEKLVEKLEARATQQKYIITFLDNDFVICTVQTEAPYISLCLSDSVVLNELGMDICIREDFVKKCLPILEYPIRVTQIDNYYHKIVHVMSHMVGEGEDFADYIKLVSDMYNLDYKTTFQTPYYV